MKRLTCFWFSLLSCSVYIKCATIFVTSSTVNPVVSVDDDSRNNWKLFQRRTNLDLQEEPYWTDSAQNRGNRIIFEKSNESGDGRTVLFPTDKCSRYCIKRDTNKNEDNFQYINLLWIANNPDIMDQRLSKDHLQLLPKAHWADSQNSNIVHKDCQIYLDLDCNVIEGGTAINYADTEFHLDEESNKTDENDFNKFAKHRFKIPMKMVERYNLSGQTQTKFLVHNTNPRIILNIDGNVSKALLQVPINATVSRHGTTISWSRKNNAEGVRIDARNAPPGEWWLKLVGEDNSNYRFMAEGFVEEKNSGGHLFFPNQRMNENFNGIKIGGHRSTIKTRDNIAISDKNALNEKVEVINSKLTVDEKQNSVSPASSKFMENSKVIQERSLKQRLQDGEQNDRREEENSEDNNSSLMYSSTENGLVMFAEYVTFEANDRNLSVSPNNTNQKSSDRMSFIEQQKKLLPRSSIGMIENLDDDDRMPLAKDVNTPMRMIETLENRELSEELVSYSNENTVEEKRMLIDVSRNSNLLVTPGTIHRIVFDVKNNCVLPVRYAFRVKSTPFRVYNVQPVYAWIYPAQMSNVAVDLIVPDNAAPDTVNTVTLYILGTEIKEKSVYLYVQGSLSKLTDDVKPTIEYSFNNNCAGKLEKDRCYKSRWSVDITIQDYDSGLKRVISSPNDIFPRTEFISGTRSPATFYYSSTCCDKTAKITAIDLLNNYNTQTIDVTAWNNLSQAEIAAITVGALLALLFIILVIILIVYCVRKRKSHDLPYTQRYGSRPPTHSERTNL